MTFKYSLEGKFTLLMGVLVLAAVGIATLMAYVFGVGWLSVLFSLALLLPAAVYALRLLTAPLTRSLQAISDGMSSLKDNDFSVSLAETRQDEVNDLVTKYNSLGEVLRTERQNLYQRELLLDTVIQATPTALVLVNARDQIVFSNNAARRMFHAGKRLEGFQLSQVLENMPSPFAQSVQRRRDGLFTVEADTGAETYHLSPGRFTLNTQPHHLFLFRQMTKELSRQEVAIWKKVIRVIAHELNNSLAPMSSLAHSGQLIAHAPDQEKLMAIFGTIEERAQYLQSFIDGYARFAKLPAPRPTNVSWQEFLDSIQGIMPFRIKGTSPPGPAYFDPAQIQQVLINLLKNAVEAGSDDADIELEIREIGEMTCIRVLDRGSGMSEHVLTSALLPFYSTKQTGTGLGLPLCREIVEAHGGRLSLANRPKGGLAVEVALPADTDDRIGSSQQGA